MGENIKHNCLNMKIQSVKKPELVIHITAHYNSYFPRITRE